MTSSPRLTGFPVPWHPHPEAWAMAAVLLGGFTLAVRARGRRHPDEPTVTPGQVLCFTLAVLTMWVAAVWPIHELSERFLYSVHMVQHLLLTLVAPPLLILGTPAWLVRRLLSPRPVFAAARTLTRPVIALVVFNGVLVFTHWPAAVDAALHSEPLHFAMHAVLFCAALLMWWPVTSPVIELPRLSYPGQVLYLFLQSLVPTVPASFLTFGSTPLYHFYATLPRLWGVSVLTDQRVAGLIMKLVGGAILYGVIAVLFFKWYAQEHAGGWDALEHRDVERDVHRGLTRTDVAGR